MCKHFIEKQKFVSKVLIKIFLYLFSSQIRCETRLKVKKNVYKTGC